MCALPHSTPFPLPPLQPPLADFEKYPESCWGWGVSNWPNKQNFILHSVLTNKITYTITLPFHFLHRRMGKGKVWGRGEGGGGRAQGSDFRVVELNTVQNSSCLVHWIFISYLDIYILYLQDSDFFFKSSKILFFLPNVKLLHGHLF